MKRQFEKLIKTTLVPGVFHATEGGALQVQLTGFSLSGNALVRMGSEERGILGINKEAAETLSDFFAELAAQL